MPVLTKDAITDAQQQVKRVMAEVRHNAADVAADATRKIRRDPLMSVGLAACAGTCAGMLMGFSLGWYTKARR